MYIFAEGFDIDSTGLITADQPGVYDVIIMRVPDEGETFAQLFHKVKVVNQEVAKVEAKNVPSKLFEGAITTLDVAIIDKGGVEVEQKAIEMSSSNEKVLQADNLYNLYAISPGKSTITISAGDIKTELEIEVEENPVDLLEIAVNNESARTGDVLQFSARAFDKSGNKLTDFPEIYSVQGNADEAASGATAQIDMNGRFVAEKPGTYMVTVSSGKQTATKAVRVGPREVERTVKMIGHGSVSDKHTSDLWIWEGVDGKDYAVTGTWGADGKLISGMLPIQPQSH